MATQEAMVNWAKNNLYRWIDMDGMYGAQCVDLTMAYTQYFGNYRMFGNAIDYLKNPLPKGWRRYLKGETNIAPGDIAIWQWGPWDIYGHVGIVIKVQGNIITSVEQNVDGTPSRGGTAKLMTRDDTHLVGFIRPCYDNEDAWQRTDETGQFKVNVTSINVRDKPSIQGHVVANYSYGEKVNYDSYIMNEGFIWISYLSYSNERRYMATGNCKNNIRTSYWGSFS